MTAFFSFQLRSGVSRELGPRSPIKRDPRRHPLQLEFKKDSSVVLQPRMDAESVRAD